MKFFLFQVYNEVILSIKNLNNNTNTMLYYIIISILFMLSINKQYLGIVTLHNSVICICTFIIIVFIVELLFIEDKLHGYLHEYHFTKRVNPIARIILKIGITWIINALFTIAGIIVACILFNETVQYSINAVITILCIQPILILLGSMGSALIFGYNNNGILLSILLIPLYLPVLIFTMNILEELQASKIDIHSISILGLIFMFFSVISPIVCKLSLQIWNE